MDEENNSQSIYCYEGTNVLINKLGIKDLETLKKYENLIVTQKLAKLIMESKENIFPIGWKVNFDEKHYIAIHKYLFEDIFDFAGELRQEFTNKTNSEIPGEEGIRIYCNPDFIYYCLKEELDKMKKEMNKIKNREDLVKFLTNHYFELYFIHPFRDGNSRTLREFMREYVMYINKFILKDEYALDYSQLNQEDNDNFVRSLIWNISSDKEKQAKSFGMLYNIFDKCLTNERELNNENRNSL